MGPHSKILTGMVFLAVVSGIYAGVSTGKMQIMSRRSGNIYENLSKVAFIEKKELDFFEEAK